MKISFKSMIALAIACTVALNANAQFEESENNRVPDRFHMGVHAGTTLTHWNVYDSNPLVFPTVGLHVDFKVAPIPLFVEAELNYVNQGYRKWTDYADEYEFQHMHAVHMPITASYHINVAPNLFVNPFAGWYVSYMSSNPDDCSDINYGVRMGCGLNFGRLTTKIGYDLGLKSYEIEKSRYNDDKDLRCGTFFVTVGFNWAGSR